MTDADFLVVRIDASGCRVLAETEPETPLHTVGDLLASARGISRVAFMPHGEESEIEALHPALRRIDPTDKTVLIVPDSRTDYELRQRFNTNSPVPIDNGFTTTGHAGFVVSTPLLSEIPADFPLSEISLPALCAISRDLAGGHTVLDVPSRNGGEYEDQLVDSPKLFDRNWYIDLPSIWMAAFEAVEKSSGARSVAMQVAFLYDMQWRLHYASNFGYKQILSDDDIDTWWAQIARVLQFISVDVIASPAWRSRLPSLSVYELVRVKGSHVSREYSANNIVLSSEGHRIGDLRGADATIELMKLKDGQFTFMGYLTFPLADVEHLVARVGAENISLHDCGRYTDFEVFGRVWFRHFAFDVRLPQSTFDTPRAEISLTVSVETKSTAVPLRLNFRRQYSKLMNTRAAYWSTDGLMFSYDTRRVRVTRARPATIAARELLLWAAIAFAARLGAARIIGLRVLYWLTRIGARRRKPVWLFADKMITAGDNGEYAFNYARRHGEGVVAYYVLDRRSRDAERLRSEGIPFIAYGSLRHKLLFLTAETVFLTHTVSTLNNSFPRGVEKFFRGLFNSRIVFIQHGLSVQHLPRILNKAFDGVDRYCIASPIERETLELPSYGYRSDELIDTGLARFDGLIDRGGNSIVISPTWRNYLALPTNSSNAVTRERGASANFATSAFYSAYAQLLTDPDLLDTARSTGTRLTFLLHPFISAQRELFDQFANDVVEVIAATENVSYEDLLTSCRALVTDYSGIQFDVAYMHKPVVYFQPKELPPSYREAVFTYSRHALGPVVKTHDDVVRAIREVMSSDGKIGEPYSQRVQDFFYFHDRENSRRIYELARELTGKATNR